LPIDLQKKALTSVSALARAKLFITKTKVTIIEETVTSANLQYIDMVMICQ